MCVNVCVRACVCVRDSVCVWYVIVYVCVSTHRDISISSEY